MKHNCFKTQPNPPPQIFAISKTAQPHACCSVKLSQQVTRFLCKTMENLYIEHSDVWNSLYGNTFAPKMNFEQMDKGRSKLQESLYSLLHSLWKRLGCRIQYSGFSCTSPGDVFYYKLSNFARSKAMALVDGVQMQLSFDFSAPTPWEHRG